MLRALESERGALVIPAPVTAEVDYLVRRRGGPTAARRFLEDLAEARFSVEGLDVRDHAMALRLHDRYSDLDLGLADLAVIILAKKHGTRRVLTFDQRHFRSVTPIQGGSFIILPADGADAEAP